MKTASFKTADGVMIAADWYPVGGKTAALLLHMMPSTKESWRDFATMLNKKGIAALAIDERGHGQSTQQEGRKMPLDYTQFPDEEQQAKIHDVEASVMWLKDKGFDVPMVMGASIGANLALWWQAEHFEARSSVLLSPGFDYRGIQTKPLMAKISAGQRVFVAGAKGDDRSGGNSAAEMAEGLAAESTSAEVQLYISEGDKHGTDLFKSDPKLAETIIAWLSV